MPSDLKYDQGLLLRSRSEQAQQVVGAINAFYASLQQCLRYTASMPIRPGRDRLFGLVSVVAANRAEEERQVRPTPSLPPCPHPHPPTHTHAAHPGVVYARHCLCKPIA